MKKAILCIAILCSTIATQAQWTRVQNFIGGEPIGIVRKSTSFYTLCKDGKVYHSYNDAENWAYRGSVSDYTTTTSYVGAKFFSSDNMLFCATKNELKRSSFGVTWNRVFVDDTTIANTGTVLGFIFIAASYNPSIDSSSVFFSDDDGITFFKSFTLQSEVLDVQTANNKVYAITEDKIYESIDGKSFIEVPTIGLPSPKNLTLGIALTGDGNSLYITTHSGLSSEVYKYTGTKWVKSSAGLPANTHYSSLNFINNVLYISAYNAITKNGGIYKSTDNAQSWQKIIGNGLMLNYLLAITALDPATLIAGFANGIYTSTDEGDSWNAKINGHVGSGNNEVLEVNNVFIIKGLYTGVYYSKDGGKSFIKPNGLPEPTIAYFYDIAATSDAIYLLTSQRDVCYLYKSINNGADWIKVNSLKNVTAILGNSGGVLFVKYDSFSINGISYYRSKDGAITWEDITSNIPISDLHNHLSTRIIGNGKDVFIYDNPNSIFKSINNGDSWAIDSVNFDKKNREFATIHYFGYLDNKPTVLVEEKNPQGLGISSHIRQYTASGWLTTDTTPLVHYVDRFEKSGDSIFIKAPDGKGVFLYTSKENRFSPYNTGFSTMAENSINDFIASKGILIATTDSAGIWLNRPTGSTTAVDYVTNSTEGLLIYPNPASSVLNIELSIAGANQFTTQLYDIQGKLLKTNTSNTAQQLIDISDIPTGMYICKITTTDKQFTSKVLVSR